MDKFDKLAFGAERESSIEGDAVRYAVSRGWFEAKVKSSNKNGIPDRLFIRNGRVVFVEFKKEGKAPTTQQLKRHAEMRAVGAEVHVIDNLKQAYDLFR